MKSLKNWFLKFKQYYVSHKIISTIVIILILGIGYYGFKKVTATSSETRYVTSTAQIGTLISSVTGSGQVSSSNQVDLKPKASGDVIYIGVKAGDEVKAGTLIAELDPQDAQKAVRDAEINLESSQIALNKLTQPADNLSLIQAQNALNQAQADLLKSYTDGWDDTSQTFVDLPNIMSGLQNLLYGTDLTHGAQDNVSAYADMVSSYDYGVNNFKSASETKYNAARDAYNKNFVDFRNSSRTMATSSIEDLIQESYNTTLAISDSIKSATDLLNFVKDDLTVQNKQIPSTVTSALTSLNTYSTQVASHVSALQSALSTISNSRSLIAEKSASLTKLQNGADPLDVKSSQLSLMQRQNALIDAKNTLNNYYVRAPFDGVIASVSVKKYDSASSGTAVATIITNKRIAEIGLNEVDASKVKVGQKVTLTFDAIDGLSISGQIAEIDSIGTVSQGVVTYNTQISFDTQDDRIKPGMSVNANIIIEAKPNVLMVPTSAVKSQGGVSLVEVFDAPINQNGNQGGTSNILPREVMVEIGDSSDTSTEITSGLKEGDIVVTRTISGQTTTGANQTPTLFSSIGGRTSGGGGNVRTFNIRQ